MDRMQYEINDNNKSCVNSSIKMTTYQSISDDDNISTGFSHIIKHKLSYNNDDDDDDVHDLEESELSDSDNEIANTSNISNDAHINTIYNNDSGGGEDNKDYKQLNKISSNKSENFVPQIVWKNVILFIVMHSCIPYACYLLYTRKIWVILYWNLFLGYLGGLGVTAGAHRLWSHKSYKARLPLRIFLAYWFIQAGQNDIYEWCRDHRVHHKFSETNADPHNSNRGFFFAHMGWLLVKKHPEVKRKGCKVDCSDLLEDPVVIFQRKYYPILMFIATFLVPTLVPIYLWDVYWFYSLIASIVRYCISLHVTWLVNSAAHIWGYRPYNDKIRPCESWFVTWVNFLGEGFHNYHHTFPKDYRASEYGWFFQCNFTAFFIDFMALIGQAYDLKTMDPSIVNKRKLKVLGKL